MKNLGEYAQDAINALTNLSVELLQKDSEKFENTVKEIKTSIGDLTITKEILDRNIDL